MTSWTFRRSTLAAAAAVPWAALTLLAPAGVRGQESPPDSLPPDTVPADTVPPGGAEAPADTAEGDDRFADYGELIGEEAVSDTGVFVVHHKVDTLYYEIPREELGRQFLWVARIARAQAGTGYGGEKLHSRVVRWQRRGDRVLLRNVTHEIVADSTKPIYRAVRDASFEPVIAAFDIRTFSPQDSAPVIDATKLFTGEVPEFSPQDRLRAGPRDSDRSFVSEALSFPENVEVEALLTFSTDTVPQVPGAGSILGGAPLSSLSLVMHHSMVRLPADPMQPRLADSRVGYFEVRQYDYGIDEHEAPRRRMINRWRLEKANPDADVSEPEEPITYYVGREVPNEWRPWIRRGVEAWNRAFREAGFRNAVVARNAPTEAEDPTWHPEDARYSVIRWQPSTIQNATGPHVHDPRTGEILEADIQIYHNVLKLLRNWYFSQVAPLDERAHRLPLPDSLMGRLVEYVVAHEVGHTLGFYHNMQASSAYPVDSLRSRSFTEKYGNEASIMDYGRFNYVAQPGDDARLVPKIGPYDEFAVMWGYRPIPGGPRAEREQLDEWARRQDENPWLRFDHAHSWDPSSQTEDLGDDPVEATRYGLRNIRRTADLLLEAAGSPGESYRDLEELYRAVVNQWQRELRHVTTVVGGVYHREKHYGQDGLVYQPVPAGRQRKAVRFLNRHAFRPPEYLLDPRILRRVEHGGGVDRVRSRQVDLLEQLLDNDVLGRLVEQEAVRAGDAEPYGLSQMLEDVRRGIWSELYRGKKVEVGPYRRNLQRAWVELMAVKLEPRETPTVTFGGPGIRFGPQPPDYPNDVRAAARGELREIGSEIDARLSGVEHRPTRLHLRDVRRVIERALEGAGGG